MEDLILECILEYAAPCYHQSLEEVKKEPSYWSSRWVERVGSNLPGLLAQKLTEKGVQLPTKP